MSRSASIRRLVENEVVFRSFNEKVQRDISRLNEEAVQNEDEALLIDENVPLYFYCECSDENCKRRIRISPKVYNDIHKARNTFTIVCGHEVKDVEVVTEKNDEFCVITKYVEPPSSATTLHKTDVDNSTKT